MTALAGVRAFRDCPVGEYCARMLKAQSAYGLSPAQAEAGPVALGRNLYSILPEDRFDRSVQSEGDFLFAADVRLDNRDELSLELGIAQSRLAKMCDARLLLESLIRWREDALDKAVGEFAFALWNAGEQSLMLARDFLGLRPLYFRRHADFFAFASMPSGLHALPKVPRSVDYDFVGQQLALLPHRGRQTYFEGIERVEPGEVLIVTGSGMRARHYWNAPEPDQRLAESAQAEEGLREVVDAAVKAQLRSSSTTVATHLSGGLDSGIVTATAARLHDPNPIVALTAVPPRHFGGKVPAGTYADEGDMAAKTGALYDNVDHVRVEAPATSPFLSLSRDCAYMQRPPDNLAHGTWFNAVYETARDRGANVLLMGAGGNLSISYSGEEWLAQLLSRGRLVELGRIWLQLWQNGTSVAHLLSASVGPLTPRPVWAAISRLRGKATDLRTYAAVRPENAAALSARGLKRGLDVLYRPRRDPLEARLWMYRRHDGADSIKAVLARTGISVRDPTVDKRVVEFCLRLPPAEYLRGGMERSIARRAFADRVPADVLHNPLRGYQAGDWYERIGPNLDEVRELVDKVDRSPSAARVIDTQWMRKALDTWPSTGWERQDVVMRYRAGLTRAVSASHFVTWVEGTN